jgi:hypothetical protein
MTAVLLAIFLAVTFIGVLYSTFVWFDRTLVSGMREHLRPGEETRFESLAMWTSGRFQSRIRFRWGRLVVTDSRLLFATWVFPPFWRTTKEAWLRDIGDLKTVVFLNSTLVQISVKGKRAILSPRATRLVPDSPNQSRRLMDAITRGLTPA